MSEANPLPQIDPIGYKIPRLLHDISIGDIKIPAFQRGFVWNQEQVLKLLDSIYRMYPIGSVLLWNSREQLKSARNIAGLLLPARTPEYPVNYVLDGQQRLSAIYAVLTANKKIDPNNNKYEIDPAIFDIYFNLKKCIFLPKQDVIDDYSNPSKFPLFAEGRMSTYYIHLSTLLDPVKWTQQLLKLDTNLVTIAADLQYRFQNYEVPVVKVTNRSKEEVGVIFERINNSGTDLSTLDLLVAWTWSEDFHLRDEIKDILDDLKRRGFSDIPEKRVLQCLSALISETARTEDILNLKAHEVRANIDKLRSSLETTIDFLATQFKVYSNDFLPHSHQIVPLAFFFSRIRNPDHEQTKYLKRWFWITSFSDRYGGSTDTRVNEDIEFFRQIYSRQYSTLRKYSLNITEEEIINTNFSLSNPISRAFILLLAQIEPLDLVYGRRIDLGQTLSSYNQKEYHHIFPKDFLKRNRLNRSINSICNFTLLPSLINKEVSNRPPAEYIWGKVNTHGLVKVALSKTTLPEDREKILHSNLMPLTETLYSENGYEEFLKKRAQLIIEFLESQIDIVGSFKSNE